MQQCVNGQETVTKESMGNINRGNTHSDITQDVTKNNHSSTIKSGTNLGPKYNSAVSTTDRATRRTREEIKSRFRGSPCEG
jgi:hypothetical protein